MRVSSLTYTKSAFNNALPLDRSAALCYNIKNQPYDGVKAENEMDPRDIFEFSSGHATAKPNSIQDYYNITPDEVARMLFDDAMVLFSTESGRVIASRSPAALFVPGEDIAIWADVPGTINSTAPCGEVFGAQRYKCADLPREARRLGLEDTFYLRTSPVHPGLALAFFGVHRAGFSKLPKERPPYPSTLPTWSTIVSDISNIGSPYNYDPFYTQIASMTRRIANAVGCGIAFNDRCHDLVTFDNFNVYAYFAVILALTMFFRRNAMRRGFNMTICSPSKKLRMPYFVFSAELYDNGAAGEPPELAVISDIATSRGLDIEYGVICKNKTPRAHIYFSPFLPENTSDDLKSLGLWDKKDRTPFDWSDVDTYEDLNGTYLY